MNESMLNFSYDLPVDKNAVYRRTLAVLVDNELGVLKRVLELFSDRGHNVESLTVSEVEHGKKLSRITIVIKVTEKEIEEIGRLLEEKDFVHKAFDITAMSRGKQGI